jgi:hypothetical protein
MESLFTVFEIILAINVNVASGTHLSVCYSFLSTVWDQNAFASANDLTSMVEGGFS